MVKRALICGVSGQDGAFLARFLLQKGYQVFGSSRDVATSNLQNLVRLGIRDDVRLLSSPSGGVSDVVDFLEDVSPDEIYNLGGLSSVSQSFARPIEAFKSIALRALNLLEAIRVLGGPLRFWNPASSECFGNVRAEYPAREDSPFRPQSPYGTAKAASYWQVSNYRNAFGLFACSGIMFNHESSLRPEGFVTRKVVHTACQIAQGNPVRLKIGQTDVVRDWGYAAEYVQAMWLMLQQPQPRDYVIATGESHSLAEFIATVFSELGLDWRDHTDVDASLFRAGEIQSSYGNPLLAHEELGWRAETRMKDLARMLVREAQIGDVVPTSCQESAYGPDRGSPRTAI